MITEDQSRVIRFLGDPRTHSGASVQHMRTHISDIFLAGDRAYKLKRAVKLPYADFSTAALRIGACEKEIELNRLTAPDLYLGIRKITRSPDGSLAFDGSGKAVDAVVEMLRFDQRHLFDRMAAAGKLTAALMDRLAHAVVRFHQRTPPVHDCSGSRNIGNVLAINAAGFAESDVFSREEVAGLQRMFEAALAAHGDRLDARELTGKVRRCHGDLHLRNICSMDGRPVIFDCIEFNDAMATVDVLYDLAFLLMDLWHRNLRGLANLVANRYFDASGEEFDFELLAFFMAVRAAVRAHVTATQSVDDARNRTRLVRSARSYFDLARGLLGKRPPLVIAIGGLSGSGKSTVAEALAPFVGAPPGARIIESDRIRKELFGKPAQERLGADAYVSDVSDRVYRIIAERSAANASRGVAVVADAVFAKPRYRHLIENEVALVSVPLRGIWLEAAPEILGRRISARVGGPSDATVAVLESQLRRGTGEIGWTRMDAERGIAGIADEIISEVGRRSSSGR